AGGAAVDPAGDAGVDPADGAAPGLVPAGGQPAHPAVRGPDLLQRHHRADPLAELGQPHAGERAVPLLLALPAVRLGHLHVVARGEPAPRDADALLPGPDALSVPAVDRSHGARIVPDVRKYAAVPLFHDRAADLG